MTTVPSADHGDRLLATFCEVLTRLAGERPGLLVVTGPDASLLSPVIDVWPERLVTVQPAMTRLGVAQGVRLGGGEAIVLLDEQVQGLLAPPAAPVLMLTTDPAQLSLAFRHGLTACQPAHPADIPPLLVGALGADGPVVMHLPTGLRAGRREDPDRCTFGEPRTLHRGRSGLIVGAGRTARAAQQVAVALAQQTLAVTAIESHTLGPDSGVDAALTNDHLLVGPLTAPRAGALEAVEVDFDDMAATATAVRHALGR